MGCKFCATGTMGFKSNLSSGEIVEQLVHASSFAQIRNVVFMVIPFCYRNTNGLFLDLFLHIKGSFVCEIYQKQ